MIKIFEKLYNFPSYLGSVFDTTSFKRPIDCDDDEEDEDDRADDIMSSPPFKRGRFTNTNLETESKIIRSGSVHTKRFFDANFHSCRTSSTRPFSSSDMSGSKGVGKIIPIKIDSSVSSNKENAPYSLSPTFSKSKEEFTPVTSKYFSNVSKLDNREDEEVVKRAVVDSSFRFMPTLTSTAQKQESSEVFSATKRKPLRSSELTPSKWSYLPQRSQSYGPSKKLTHFSRSSKQRTFIKPYFWKKCFATRESIRLEERERYSQLLQQHTSSIVTPSRIIGKTSLFSLLSKGVFSPDDKAEKCGAIMKTYLDPQVTSKNKLLLKERESSPVKTTLKIPKDIRDSSAMKSIPLIDLEPEREINKEVKLDNDDDDDLIIVKEIKPAVSRNNSLENEFQKSLCYNHDWLKEMTDIYHDEKKASDDDVEVMFETKRKCQESREKQQKEFLKKVEDRISQLDIAYPRAFIEVTEEEEEKFPELTPEIENVIERAFRGGPPTQVLAEKFNIQIKRRDIQTLAGLNWLNDEVINFYMNMLMERGKNDNYPSVYTFNTFFYSKLVKTGYASVKRWTKKVDIFSYDLLIIPVHLGMHWCLATIDFREKAIKYYDSMHGNNNTCLMGLSKYLESEHQDKKKSSFAVSAFSVENVKDIPQQMNGSDCGMFSCKFAEYLSRDAPISFTQEHMPYFRRRMVYEIVTQTLM